MAQKIKLVQIHTKDIFKADLISIKRLLSVTPLNSKSEFMSFCKLALWQI